MANEQSIIIYGADDVGKAMLSICSNVIGFVDYNPDLTGTKIEGIPVYPPSELKKFKDAHFIISVINIRAVVETLQAQGIYNWTAGGSLLYEYDITQLANRIDDIRYQIESCILSHRAFLKKDYVFLNSLDVVITERCSLRCRDCSNLMPYFKSPKNYKVAEILKDVDNLLQYTDEIMEARIIGGDPLMHPQWLEFVKGVLQSSKIKRVLIYTNGLIKPSLLDLPTLAHKKVIIIMTDYKKLSKNLNTIIELFENTNVKYKIVELNKWIDCASIYKHNRTPQQNDSLFVKCVSTNLLTLSKGKLFRCPYAASAFQLKAVRDVPRDYVNVKYLKDKKTLHNYVIGKRSMSVCDYCISRQLENEIPPAIQTKVILPYEVI